MLSYDEALAILIARSAPGPGELVELEKAGRRILSEPIFAAIDSPRCDVSAMDGYAVRRCDLDPLSRPFEVTGESFPGRPCDTSLGVGNAVRIFTGAPLPDGADQILVQEEVRREGKRAIFSGPAPPRRDHIRRRGSDFRKGDQLLDAGAIIDSRALMIASAGDATHVRAFGRPVVKVIATGDEICAPGDAKLRPLTVPDSLSGPILMSVRQWGGVPGGAARLPDRLDELAVAARSFLDDSDILVIAGGASTGERDFAKPAFAELGMELHIPKVGIKPGKPLWYGKVGGTHVLGLPGNPAAALITARLFLAPLIYHMAGRDFRRVLDWRDARLAVPLDENGPREAFLGARRDGNAVAPVEGLSASSQLLLSHAELLLRRAPGAGPLPAGATVQVLRF